MKKLQIVIIIALTILISSKLSFIPWPEMLLRPYLLLNGWLPYTDFVMEHAPLLLYILSIWYKFFGLGVIQLKAFTLVIIITNALILFSDNLFVKLKVPRFILSIFYVFLCFSYEGFGLWYDLMLSLAVLLLYISLQKNRLYLSGITLGLIFLIKQNGILFLLPSLYIIGLDKHKIRKFILGLTTVGLSALLVFYLLGYLKDFINFGFSYPAPFQFPTVYQLVYFSPFILIFIPGLSDKLKIWTIFGLTSIIPRWGLFHFQVALPFLVLLFGDYLNHNNYKFSKIIYLVLVLLFFSRQFSQIWGKSDRFQEPEFLETVSYLTLNTSPGQQIYAQNTWESIYPLSKTLPATKPFYPYLPWYLTPIAQSNITKDLAITRPVYIISGEVQQMGLGSFNPKVITDYVNNNYQIEVKIGSLNVFKKY